MPEVLSTDRNSPMRYPYWPIWRKKAFCCELFYCTPQITRISPINVPDTICWRFIKFAGKSKWAVQGVMKGFYVNSTGKISNIFAAEYNRYIRYIIYTYLFANITWLWNLRLRGLCKLWSVPLAELGTGYFFLGSLIAKSLICFHGSLSLKRNFF